MYKIYSIDLMICDDHSADAIYQQCLYKSFQKNFQLLSTNTYQTNSDYCEKILVPIIDKNILSKSLSILKNSFILFKKIRTENNAILIFQSFFASEIIITFLLTLFNRLLLNRREYKIVLIMRFEFSKIQKIIFPLFIKLLPKNTRILFFTDTAELQLIHQNNIKQNVVVLPIPHTFKCEPVLNDRSNLRIGFPGFPRKEKGFELIGNIIENINYDNIIYNLQDWQLYKNNFVGKKNVNLNFQTKSRKNYTDYICSCDIIILPYTNRNYINRSSGIFAESIVSQKIVLVSNGTWMSNQLQLMDLEEFIIKDFNDLIEVREKIFYIKNNLSFVKNEFKNKTVSFSNFHNQEMFNKIFLENIFN